MEIFPIQVDYETELSALYYNQSPLEQTNLISSTGITPSANDLNQSGKSVANYVAVGNLYLDSGSANAYVLSPISESGLNFQGITRYFTGARIRFTASNANTGASTVNVNGLGAISIKLPSGADPLSGDIPISSESEIIYNGTNWILQTAPSVQDFLLADYASAGDFYVDSGIANAYILSAASGFHSISQYRIGGIIRFIPLHANTGASIVNINGYGNVNILLINNSNPSPGDIQQNKECVIFYNGTNFILQNPLGALVSSFPQGYQYKARINSNASSPNTHVDFLAGSVRDQSNLSNIVLNSMLSKDITLSWAAGNGNGGNSVPWDANTCYACFLIIDASGNVDAGFDTDINATNLLSASGYLYYRRRGYILTDPSARVREFYTDGLNFWYKNFTDTEITVANTTSATLITPTSPTANLLVYLFHSIVAGAGINSVAITSAFSEQPTVNTASYYTAYTDVPDGNADMTSTRLSVVTTATPQVYIQANQADGSDSLIYTLGWQDLLED
jgi:hypothetical protein